jgi:hypothetical protein
VPEKWQTLRRADPSELNEEEKELLKRLAHEFISDTDLKPARLRPISSLQFDMQDTPGFTRFAQMIRNTCRLHSGLTPKERQDIVEELYTYELVRTYLPGSRLTSVEQDVLTSISTETPKILPSALLRQLNKDVAEKRRQETEGIR